MKERPNHISQEDWDAVDSPPLSGEQLSKLRPAREVAPELIALHAHIQKQRGRPKSAEKKTAISIRLSNNVITEFRKLGEGWQTRMNDVLEAYVEKKKRRGPRRRTRVVARKAAPRRKRA